RHVQHHAAGDDAVGPVLDAAEGSALERDLLLGITAVPHALLVPGVTEGVDVGRGHAVIEDAVVVGGEAAAPARHRAHVVLGRVRIAGPRLLGKRPAQRHAAAAAHQARGGHALGVRDQVDGPALVVLAPAPPVAAITEVA